MTLVQYFPQCSLKAVWSGAISTLNAKEYEITRSRVLKKKCCKSAPLDAPVVDKTWWSVLCSDKMCKTMRENALGLPFHWKKVVIKYTQGWPSSRESMIKCPLGCPSMEKTRRSAALLVEKMWGVAIQSALIIIFFASAFQKAWVCHDSQIQQYDNDYLLLFWLKIAKTLSPSCHFFLTF